MNRSKVSPVLLKKMRHIATGAIPHASRRVNLLERTPHVDTVIIKDKKVSPEPSKILRMDFEKEKSKLKDYLATFYREKGITPTMVGFLAKQHLKYIDISGQVGLMYRLCTDTNKFKPYEIINIIQQANTEPKIEKVDRLLNDEELQQKIKFLEQKLKPAWTQWNKISDNQCDYDFNLYLRTLQGDIPPENFDLTRINSLYNFMKENPANFHQDIGEVSDASISSIFGAPLISSLDFLDDEMIKYAMKFGVEGLKSFTFDLFKLTHGLLPDKIDEKLLLQLKNNLAKLDSPQDRVEKLQTIIGMKKALIADNRILKVIDAIKSPEATTMQIKQAEEIFASDKPYIRQIKEFIDKLNVPNKKKKEIIAFLKQRKLNQAIIGDVKTKENVLSMSAKRELAKKIKENINAINYKEEFNTITKKELYRLMGIKASPELLKKVTFDPQYFHLLFNAANNISFANNFRRLINILKTDLQRPLSEIREILPYNIATNKLFKKNRIDYNKWVQFNKYLTYPFSIKIDKNSRLDSMNKALAEYLNGDLFNSVDKSQTNKILKALADQGYIVGKTEISAKDKDSITQKDLQKIVAIFEYVIRSNADFWEHPLSDITAETLKTNLKRSLSITFKREVERLSSLQNKNLDLIVRLTDTDNIGRNMFTGNHIGNEFSVNSSYGFRSPQKMIYSFIREMEIVDKTGKSYGNSICYFAKVNGQLSLIIDQFKIDSSLDKNHNITNAIINYAKQVITEVGRPDANIYFGTHVKNFSTNALQTTYENKIEALGYIVNDTKIYLDALGGLRTPIVSYKDKNLLKR